MGVIVLVVITLILTLSFGIYFKLKIVKRPALNSTPSTFELYPFDHDHQETTGTDV